MRKALRCWFAIMGPMGFPVNKEAPGGVKPGDRLGSLTAVRFDHRDKHNCFWEWRCDCGNSRISRPDAMRRSAHPSCGCQNLRGANHPTRFKVGGPNPFRSHGMSGTFTYRSWKALHNRCNNPNNSSYPSYGKLGVSVCERWNKFENFFEDMGERPIGTSIDRIDPTGNYEPSNCRWADDLTQRRNTRKNYCKSGSLFEDSPSQAT